MSGDFYVYAHVNPITKKIFYIGKGNAKRCYSSFNRNKFWYSTVSKYGFAVVKLVEGLTDEQALEIEKQYIAKHGLRVDGGSLVNLTYGGEGAALCEDVKRRMSISRTGIRPSEETRLKLKQAKTGINNPNYGKKTWLSGKPLPEESKRKMIATKTGVKQSEEVRRKSLEALEIAKEARKETYLRVRCLKTGKVWRDKNECIADLKLTIHQFKEWIRPRTNGRRGIKKLEYLKN